MKNLLFLITLFFLLTACSRESDKVKQTTEVQPLQETNQIYFEVKEYETKKLEVFTEKAKYSGDTTFIYNFMVNFFDADTVTAEMVGDTGIISEYEGFMEVIGDIRLRSMSGDSLLTRTLRWNKKLNLIYSPTESKLYKGGKVITSSGLESDPGLRVVKFKGKVYVE